MKKLIILSLFLLNCNFVQANEQVNDTFYNAKEVVNNYKFYRSTTDNQYFPYKSVIKNGVSNTPTTNNYYGMYQDFKNDNINTGTVDYLKNILNSMIQ